MKAIAMSRNEESTLIAQQRLDNALRKSISKDTFAKCRISDEVLMYREKPVAKWIGPCVVRGVSGKFVTMDTGDCIIIASIYKLKLYSQNSIAEEAIHTDDIQNGKNQIFHRERAQLEALLKKRTGTQATRVTVDLFVEKCK